MQEFFSPLAFDFLWESARVGELPYPLIIRSHGATEDERVSLRHRTDVELKARGVRAGQPSACRRTHCSPSRPAGSAASPGRPGRP